MSPRLQRFLRAALWGAALLLPGLAWACPRCVNSSPYHRGLILGAAFLLPLPFFLMGFIAWRMRKTGPEEDHATQGH